MAFHESGHALAGLATCAHITSVEIDPELGGLTQMRGGIQWIYAPCRYISYLKAPADPRPEASAKLQHKTASLPMGKR